MLTDLGVESARSQFLIEMLFFETLEALLLVEHVAMQPFFREELTAEAEVGLLC